MNLSAQAQAVMLLTVRFGKHEKTSARPLSAREWARFAVWLKDHDLDPSALLQGELRNQLSEWTDRSISLSRLEGLLERGGALGLALEKWQRAGLWIITRSAPEYPQRLKRRLRMGSPPVLFGCGNKALLENGGIAVVGSRHADQDALAFAENIGSAASAQGYSIVSGGARGVDQSAMFSALQKEGTAIGVLADSLMRAATSARYRKYLLSNDLVLTTPFNPEAGFNVGNAMSRNRYIYCLADAAVVASSTPNRGGTWNGAIEDLKSEWVPLWVKRTESEKSGNPHLVRRGAQWFPDELPPLERLVNGSSAKTDDATVDQPLLKVSDGPTRLPDRQNANRSAVTDTKALSRTADAQSSETNAPKAGSVPKKDELDFYMLFQNRVLAITANGPKNPDEIALSLKLHSSQVKAWLKQGMDDGKITKLMRPVRYQSTAHIQRQAPLFAEDG